MTPTRWLEPCAECGIERNLAICHTCERRCCSKCIILTIDNKAICTSCFADSLAPLGLMGETINVIYPQNAS